VSLERPAYRLTQPGWIILAAAGLLLAMGVATIFVANTHYQRVDDGPINAGKQIVFALFSVAVALLTLRIGYRNIARHAYLIFAIVLLALIPLAMAQLLNNDFGGLMPKRNGAYRWIRLPGFQLQPSEFMKLAYILALAWYLRYRKNYRRFSGLLLPFLISVIPLALILVEPDLGTALLMIPVLFAMLFIAGARLWHLALIILIGVLMMPPAWARIQPYQKLRVTAVLLQSESLRQAIIDQPELYKLLATKRQALQWERDSGYQLVHALYAVGSGGLTGHGWGEGVYVEKDWLPDRHNDLIFAMIAHQWGLLGCLLMLICYAVMVAAGVYIASATPEPFGRLLAVGVVSLIATQVLINMGMTVGLMPITGMTLPFVSYGGSSLLTNFLALALLISVSQHRPFLLESRPFEFDAKKQVHPAELEAALPAGRATAANRDS
jgi:rod shape determining protein RodA